MPDTIKIICATCDLQVDTPRDGWSGQGLLSKDRMLTKD